MPAIKCRFLVLILAGAGWMLEAAASLESSPNVVVFISDDQGWGDLSFNGNRELATPNVDSLASGQPFFAYLPYNTPHSPMQVPDEYWQRFKDKEFEQLNPRQKGTSDHDRAAYAMCENIDWNVGRVLQKLDELQLADHTIVVYFNDNGPNGYRWIDGYKGKKGSVDEGGVKSPLHIRYPGKIKPGTVVESISSVTDSKPFSIRPSTVSTLPITMSNSIFTPRLRM